MRTKGVYFLFIQCMIHQFFDYETIKEGFSFTESPDTPDTPAETPTETPEPSKPEPASDNTKLLKDVGLLIVFYILFVIIFMISGSVIFKYIIMTRMGKSVVGCIPGFPDDLNYRKKSSEFYNKFFAGGKEALINKEYQCHYFKYIRKDEKNEKTKVYIPITFSYKPYYNNWLYRDDFNTGIPGTIYSLDADMDRSTEEGEVNPMLLSNSFPINWFWSSFTTVFTCTNTIFTNGMYPSIAIIIVLFLSLSNTISMASTTINQNTYPSVFTILSSIVHSFSFLIYIPVLVFSFASLFWSINLVNYYEEGDKQMHLRFLRFVFFDNFWFNLGAKIIAICAIFACLILWLWFNFIIVFGQFLPFVFTVMFFICILSNSYGKYTYNNETKDLNFSNILLELFPIYCATNRWIIFFMLFAFVLLASAINPTIGAITFFCMFFGILIFYTSIKKMIQSILLRFSTKIEPNDTESNTLENDFEPEPSFNQNSTTMEAKKDIIKLIQELNEMQGTNFKNEDVANTVTTRLVRPDGNTSSNQLNKTLEKELKNLVLSKDNRDGNDIINKLLDTLRNFLSKTENYTNKDVNEKIEDAVIKAINEINNYKGYKENQSNQSEEKSQITETGPDLQSDALSKQLPVENNTRSNDLTPSTPSVEKPKVKKDG